jgi:hypothetical protein
MPNKRQAKAKDVMLAAIGREWDAWARKQGTPLTGASGTEAFKFFEYLQNERIMFDFRTSSNIKASKNNKWQSIQTYLKRTGWVAE